MEYLHALEASNITTIGVGVVVFALAAYVIRRGKSRRNPPGNPPPGPRGIPFYGNSWEMKRCDVNGPGILDKWGKQFGPIYSLRLGVHRAVVLNNVVMVREVLLTNQSRTSARPTNVFVLRSVLKITNCGLTLNEGDLWRDTKRTVIRALRDFGMGKKSLESRIQEEARALVDHLDTLADKALDLRLPVHNAISNVIFCIIFGDRFEYDDPEFTRVSGLFFTLFQGGGFNPELFSPFLLPLLPLMNPGLVGAIRSSNAIKAWINEKIKQHRQKFDLDNINSFLDIYLNAEKNGEFNDGDTEKNLFYTILDLCLAGSETSTTSLLWAVVYLTNYPEVQRKCQQTILKEVEPGVLVSSTDRDKMPYIMATIHEIQRIATIAPYGLLHRAEASLEVAGYTIEKDTLIIPNLHALHRDQQYWTDPERFDPDRWLDAEGRLVKHDSFLPFSLGPRECLGKNLALQELFIFLVTLLQRFSFTPADPDNPPPIAGSIGITYAPHPFCVTLDRV